MFSTIFKEPTIMTYNDDFSASPVKSYEFARNLFFVPLLQNEVARAAFDYPLIVAKTQDGIFPAALLSLREHVNPFVNEKGEWEKEFHVPAFLKTYPFVLTKPEWNQESRMMYDKAYNGINKKDSGAIEIIKDEKLTEPGKKVFERLKDHYGNFDRTKQLYSEINTMGLLKEVEVKLLGRESTQEHIMTGFYQIDAEKLNKLNDEKLLMLAKSGILGLIQFHLASSTNIQKLKNRL